MIMIQQLRERLHPCSKVLAGQDFKRTMQGDSETVADNVCHLERAFHVVFGSDSLNWETKEAMLHVSIGRANPRLASLLIVQQLKLEETPCLEKLDFSDILNQLTELLSLAISPEL